MVNSPYEPNSCYGLSNPSAGTKVKMTCGQAIIEFFMNQYVEQLDGNFLPMVYGYWGIFGHGNVCGLGEALEQGSTNGKLKYFRGQNEQGMALAAMAYAKASKNRRVCAVTTSIGPGATNMVTAAACAHTNRIPILLLPGDIFATRRPHPVLQQLEDVKMQYSVNECFKPVSVFFDRLFRPEQLIDSLPKAAKALTNPSNLGPVVLSMPQDLQAEAYEFPVELFKQRKHFVRRVRPDLNELNTLCNLLKSSQRPLFVCGGGVLYSGACDSISQFCARTGVPVCESQAGKGSVPDSGINSGPKMDLAKEINALGGVGVTGNKIANEMLQKADLLVSWGCRLGDFTTSSNAGIPKTCQLVSVNLQDKDATKLAGQSVVGDIKTVIEMLNEQTKGWKIGEGYKGELVKGKADWLLEREKICSHPKSDSLVVKCVNEVAAQINGIAVSAAGGLPGEMQKMWLSTGNDDYHLEYAYSCMGYEVAGSVGVKMAVGPNKEVFCMVGDGSWLMMHTEIVSARTLGYPITVVLVDNAGFGCIHRLQTGNGINEFGNIQHHGCDFVQIAKGLGVEIVVKVDKCADLKSELLKYCAPEAGNQGKCKVFVVETDPDYTSPGYSWWDCAPPEVATKSSRMKEIGNARQNYDSRLGSREAKL